MADDVNAQEHLEAVKSIIVTCESTAIEIENQFAQFDTVLGEAESRSTELISELDTSSAEVVTHTEEFQSELTESIGQMVERVGDFVSTMATMLETVESNSSELFNKLTEMDGAHDEISSRIEENASHMKEIFDTLSTSWTEVAEKITSLQEERHTEIDTNVRELSETQAGQQQEDMGTTLELHLDNFNNILIDGAQEHFNDIAGDFKESFIPGVESLTEKNKELQEQGGSDFSQMRSENSGQNVRRSQRAV